MDIEFSVAADFKRSTLDAYDQLNQRYSGRKVAETFGQISIGNQLDPDGPGICCRLLPKSISKSMFHMA